MPEGPRRKQAEVGAADHSRHSGIVRKTSTNETELIIGHHFSTLPSTEILVEKRLPFFSARQQIPLLAKVFLLLFKIIRRRKSIEDLGVLTRGTLEAKG